MTNSNFVSYIAHYLPLDNGAQVVMLPRDVIVQERMMCSATDHVSFVGGHVLLSVGTQAAVNITVLSANQIPTKHPPHTRADVYLTTVYVNPLKGRGVSWLHMAIQV